MIIPMQSASDYRPQFQPSLYDRETMLAQKAVQTEGLISDYRFSNGYYDNSFIEQMHDQKSAAMTWQAQAFQEIQQFQWAHQSWFSQLAKVRKENFDFVLRDQQWTPEDEKAMIKRGRKPYVVNMLKPHWRRIKAEMIAQRTEWRGVGGPNWEDKSELINHIFRWVAQINNYQQVQVEVYEDGMVGNVGMSGTMLDPYDPYGAIRIERYRPDEFMWDIYSAHDNALSKTNYFLRSYFKDKKTLSAIYPAWEKEILEAQTGVSGTMAELSHTIMRPKVSGLTGYMEQSTSFDGYLNTLYGQLVFTREFYRRRPIAKYTIRNNYNNTEEKFDNIQDAYTRGRDLVQFYFAQFIRSGGDPNQFFPRISMPQVVTSNVVDRLVWVGDILIDLTTSDDDYIPYQPFIPESKDGEIKGFFEGSKGPQRFRNVAFSAMHQAMAGIKPTRLVNKAKLTGKMTDRQIEEKSVREGETWIFNDPMGLDLKGVMINVDQPQIGTLPQVMHAMMSDDINNANGGLNAIGITENAGESGKAILQRRSAASMSTAGALDAFADWNRRVGESVLHLSQYLDPTMVMTVSDDMGESITRSIIDDGIQSIKGVKAQVTVKEVLASPTERDARLERAIALAGQSQEVAADMMPIVLKYADFDISDRRLYEESRDARIKQQQANIEADRQIAMRDLVGKEQDRKISHLVKLKEISVLEENKPKTSISLKLPATPEIVADQLDRSGSDDVHPLGVAASMAMNDYMEIEKTGMLTKQEFDLTPAWARKPTAKTSGQSSGKSQSARKNKKVDKK